jgi:hypothetical protein
VQVDELLTTWATYLDGRRFGAGELLHAHDEHNTIRRTTAIATSRR